MNKDTVKSIITEVETIWLVTYRWTSIVIEKSQLFKMFLQLHMYCWFWIPWWANCYKYIFLDFRDGLKCGVDNCRRLQPYISTFEAADDCCYDPGILSIFFHFIAFLSVYPLISPLSLYLFVCLTPFLALALFLKFCLDFKLYSIKVTMVIRQNESSTRGQWAGGFGGETVFSCFPPPG